MFGTDHDDDGWLWLDGGPVPSTSMVTLRAPFDDRIVATVHQAGPAELERALTGATRLRSTMASLPRHRRRAILDGIARGIAAHKQRFVDWRIGRIGPLWAPGPARRPAATRPFAC
jgi:acyl-CoA reductase-like NAD-dependent aldehyde dehydrogenase